MGLIILMNNNYYLHDYNCDLVWLKQNKPHKTALLSLPETYINVRGIII